MAKSIVSFVFFFCVPIFPHAKVEQCTSPKDLQQVVAMIAANDDTHMFMPIAIDPEEKARCMKAFLEEPFRKNFIIRNEKERIVAYLTLSKKPSPSQEFVESLDTRKYALSKKFFLSWPALPKKSSGFVLVPSIIVAISERRKGLARKLMQYAQCYAAQDSGLEAIHVSVDIKNTAAISLYQSLGYKELLRNDEMGLLLFRKKMRAIGETNIHPDAMPSN